MIHSWAINIVHVKCNQTEWVNLLIIWSYDDYEVQARLWSTKYDVTA